MLRVKLAVDATRLGDLDPARGQTVVVPVTGVPASLTRLGTPRRGVGDTDDQDDVSLDVAVAGSLVLYELAGLP